MKPLQALSETSLGHLLANFERIRQNINLQNHSPLQVALFFSDLKFTKNDFRWSQQIKFNK